MKHKNQYNHNSNNSNNLFKFSVSNPNNQYKNLKFNQNIFYQIEIPKSFNHQKFLKLIKNKLKFKCSLTSWILKKLKCYIEPLRISLTLRNFIKNVIITIIHWPYVRLNMERLLEDIRRFHGRRLKIGPM